MVHTARPGDRSHGPTLHGVRCIVNNSPPQHPDVQRLQHRRDPGRPPIKTPRRSACVPSEGMAPTGTRCGRSAPDRSGLRAAAGILALGIVVLAGAWSLRAHDASAASPEGSPSSQVIGGNAAAGAALFQATCASCHGQQGRGTAQAPSLEHAGTALIEFMVRTGRMPLSQLEEPVRRGARILDDGQTRDLLAYLAPLTDGPGPPQMVTSGAALGRGRELFAANCAACHGATGAGDAIGGGIVAPSLDRSTSQDVSEAVVGGPAPMPRFSFTPDDLAAITAYVQYLRDPRRPGGSSVARLGPVTEGFIAAAIALVVLVLVARWVARSPAAAQREPLPAAEEPPTGAPQ